MLQEMNLIGSLNQWAWKQTEILAKKSPNLTRILLPIPIVIHTGFFCTLSQLYQGMLEIKKIPQGKIHLLYALQHLSIFPLVSAVVAVSFAIGFIRNPLLWARAQQIITIDLGLRVDQFCKEEKISDPKIKKNIIYVVHNQVLSILANMPPSSQSQMTQSYEDDDIQDPEKLVSTQLTDIFFDFSAEAEEKMTLDKYDEFLKQVGSILTTPENKASIMKEAYIKNEISPLDEKLLAPNFYIYMTSIPII